MEPELSIGGKSYTLVAIQRRQKTAVYGSAGEYLRIGEPETIQKDLALHKKMETAGFPVASLIAEGEHAGMRYFIEQSLGEKHFGKLFADDVERERIIADETFASFLHVVERFAKAQLSTATNVQSFDEFAEGFQLDTLIAELPEREQEIRALFDGISKRLSVLPFVITHGDFNPNNMYPEGVTDLEDSFYAPVGYDLITAITHINYFPDSPEYEYFARYRYTETQKKNYLATMDGVFREAGLPPLSGFADDFEFCRAVWSSVNMNEWSKIQKFRYDLLAQKFLSR